MSTISIVLCYIDYERIALHSGVVALFFVVLYAFSNRELSFFSLAIPKCSKKIILVFLNLRATEVQTKIVDKPSKLNEVKKLMIF